MYNLRELEKLLKSKENWNSDDKNRHLEILETVHIASKNFSLRVPSHWL